MPNARITEWWQRKPSKPSKRKEAQMLPPDTVIVLTALLPFLAAFAIGGALCSIEEARREAKRKQWEARVKAIRDSNMILTRKANR